MRPLTLAVILLTVHRRNSDSDHRSAVTQSGDATNFENMRPRFHPKASDSAHPGLYTSYSGSLLGPDKAAASLKIDPKVFSMTNRCNAHGFH